MLHDGGGSSSGSNSSSSSGGGGKYNALASPHEVSSSTPVIANVCNISNSSGGESDSSDCSSSTEFQRPHQHHHSWSDGSSERRRVDVRYWATGEPRVPPRLTPPHGGFRTQRPLVAGQEHYFIMPDIETSGPIYGVHSVLAVAWCLLGIKLTPEDTWELRVHQLVLFAYPQESVQFADGMLSPGGFWYDNRSTLLHLRDTAKDHGESATGVTARMADWLDNTMRQYDYPNFWGDHNEYDIGHVNLLYGMHLHRPPLSHILQSDGTYVFGRRAFSTQNLGLWLIPPEKTNFFDPSGSPNLCNHALRFQNIGPLEGLVVDHNPLNDVQKLAMDFGRLLCRMWDLRMQPHRLRSMVCYAFDRREPLRECASTRSVPSYSAPDVGHRSAVPQYDLSRGSVTDSCVRSSGGGGGGGGGAMSAVCAKKRGGVKARRRRAQQLLQSETTPQDDVGVTGQDI